LEGLGIEGKVVLEWILKIYGVRVWNVFGQGPVVGSCEHGLQLLDSIRMVIS
jgi:hypothetical protein